MVNFGDTRLPNRFWDKCIPEPNSGCWLWLATTDRAGYGRISMNGSPRLAHRVSYAALVGHIHKPFIDHKCRNTSCVNPDHLEPVTNAENVLRGIAGKKNAAKTHCPRGHAYDGGNLFLIPNQTRSKQSRCCRICKNDRNFEYRVRVARPLREASPELLAWASKLLVDALASEPVWS